MRPCQNDSAFDDHKSLLCQLVRFLSAACDWLEDRRQFIYQLFEYLRYSLQYDLTRLRELAPKVPHQASVSPKFGSNCLKMIEQAEESLDWILHLRIYATFHTSDAV